MIQNFIIFLLILINCSAISYSEENFKIINSDDLFQQKENLRNNTINFIPDLTLFKELPQGINKLVIKNFVINDKTSNLILYKQKPAVDKKTLFYTGNTISDYHPDIKFFSGFLEGEQNSEVVLTFVNGYLFGRIYDKSGNEYIIGPKHGTQNKYVISRIDNFDFPTKEINDTEIDYKQLENIRKSTNDATFTNDLLEAEVAVETDTEFFKATGSDLNLARAYIISVYNHVSLIYEEQTGITIKILWMKNWTDSPSDPYDAKGSYETLRDRAIPYWTVHYGNVERDVYQVVTSIGNGGGGWGYFNALCGRKENGMSATSLQGWNNLSTFNFTYDVYITAHELGHNFNARHTHSCFWNDIPLDTCVVDNACVDDTVQARPNPGSIMSYCGVTNNQYGLGYHVRMKFLPENIEIIRATAESADCITKAQDPPFVLLLPRGDEILKPGEVFNIRWKSQSEKKLKLEYSDDSGLSWFLIDDNLSPEDTVYKWSVPEVCSKSVFVKISETGDDSLSDMNYIPFTIKAEEPSGLVAYYPFAGDSKDKSFCGFYDMSPENNPGMGTDRFGENNNSYSFNGSNYLVSENFDASFDELTVSFWFKLDNNQGKRNIVGTNYQSGWVFAAYYWNQLGVSYYIDGKGVPEQLWAGSLQTGRFYHGVFTFNGDSAKYYVDGVLKAEKSYSPKAALNKFYNTPLYIGSRKDNDYFAGSIDDVRIYKRALNESEIISLFNETDLPPDPPDLISPPDNSKDIPETQEFDWESGLLIYSYRFQLSLADSNFNNNIIVDAYTYTKNYNINKLKPESNYYWRVASINIYGLGEWSEFFSFTTGKFTDVDVPSRKDELNIFPNPANDKIFINLPVYEKFMDIIIYDYLGRYYLKSKLRYLKYPVEIDVNDLPAGIYFMIIRTLTNNYAVQFSILR